MNNTFVYEHTGSLYINLTNKCTNNCEFCIRNISEGIGGYDLWLENEPTADEVIESLEKHNVKNFKEIVFCGYGEPTVKLNVLLVIAKYVKEKYPKLITRINTNGQANLFHGKDVTPNLVGLIDKLSVSLNAPDAQQYQMICRSDFGEEAYKGLLEFSKLALKRGLSVRLTVVDIIGEEKIAQCQKIADDNGLKLYVRHTI